jgi:hypothetical protein
MGDLVIVSASASQLGPYASGAGRLILLVGSKKIVRDLDEAMRRIEETVFPYQDALVHERMNISTFIARCRSFAANGWTAGSRSSSSANLSGSDFQTSAICRHPGCLLPACENES